MLKGSHILSVNPGLCVLCLGEVPTDVSSFESESSFSSLFKRLANCPLQVAFFSVKKTKFERLTCRVLKFCSFSLVFKRVLPVVSVFLEVEFS